ncbi:MAG: heme exporter protein CcmD [Bacteroidaceae bacterium]|nr:heme exporter protein CcmD [Bacteroidaceae bacterium]
MRLFRNPNTTVAILAIYTAIVYAYLFPRNNEMSDTEKWITVGASVVVLAILWILLRKREKLRKEREEDSKK